MILLQVTGATPQNNKKQNKNMFKLFSTNIKSLLLKLLFSNYYLIIIQLLLNRI